MASWALACKNCRKVSPIPRYRTQWPITISPRGPRSRRVVLNTNAPIAGANPLISNMNSRISPTASSRLVLPDNSSCSETGRGLSRRNRLQLCEGDEFRQISCPPWEPRANLVCEP
jgi:hypothetical protein